MLTNMHGFSATSCTGSVHLHARVGVQHNGPYVALKPCNVPCTVSVQHRNTFTGLLIPACTTCKPDVFQYPNFSTTPFDLPDHQGDSRPRSWVGGVA